jgi:pectinesterase
MKKLKTVLFFLFISYTSFLWGQDLEQALGGKVDIIVAKDGSGNYTSVTAAINSVTKYKATRTVIFVKKGTYTEKLEVESGINKVTLIGEDIDSTIIAYNDYSGSGIIYNGIISSKIGDPIGTSTSHTMYIDSDEFILMNMTIINNAGDVGQAVAMNLGGDRTILVHCRILGNQDTFYTWGYGRFYMKDCFIEGDVDFIFGRGAALFDSCIINTNKSSKPITAASTDAGWKFGYVFQNCKVTANYGISGVTMGRPWRADAQTVFMNCFLDKHISAPGWSEWSGNTNHTTCFYAEYNNYGPGSDTTYRVSWSHQLSDAEAQLYTMANIFAKNVNPSNFSSDWMPDLQDNEVYKILKANTSLLYLDSLQNNAGLKYIKVNGVDIEGFNQYTKSYNIELQDTLTNPVITAEPLSDKAAMTIEEPVQLPGNATITVKAINGFTFKYTLEFVVPTKVEKTAIPVFNMQVLNNPFNETLNIKAENLTGSEPLEISFYSLTGQMVLFKKLENASPCQLINIQAAHIPCGVYLCSIRQGTNTVQQKVVKN